MKNILLLGLLMAIGQLLSAQCIPGVALPVFDSTLAYMHSYKVLSSVPSGALIKVTVREYTDLRIDMCLSNNAAAFNDSYVTLLDGNDPNANFISMLDDGCGTAAGPTHGVFPDLDKGVYYLYITQIDGNGNCIADGVYNFKLTISGHSVTHNDSCTNPTELDVDVPTVSNNYHATSTTAFEGLGADPTFVQPNGVGIFAPAHFPDGAKVLSPVWYYIDIPVAGTYTVTIEDSTADQFWWAYNIAFYPTNDIDCNDINQSDLSNGLYRIIERYDSNQTTIKINLQQGSYWVPLAPYADYSSQNTYFGRFTITVAKAVVDENCDDADAGGLTVESDCVVYGDNINITQTGNHNLPGIGTLASYYALYSSSQPITNFADPSSDPNIEGGDYATLYDGVISLSTIDPVQGFPVGTYYYYLLAASDYRIDSSGITFNTACLDSAVVMFRVVDSVQECATIGINQPLAQPKFNIYPNPSTGQFSIALGKAYNKVSVTITTLTGQVIQHHQYHQTSTIELMLDAPVGMYLVTIAIPDGTRQVVKLLRE